MRVVGLFYCNSHQPEMVRLAEICVASVRRHMDAHVVQLTDLATDPFPFVDEVCRKKGQGFGLMEFRMHHFASYEHSEAMFLDLDTVVQADVWDVFDDDFDVALTTREKKIVYEGKDVSGAMPYNTGVMFSRGTAFWRRVCELMTPLPIDDRNWFGEQIVIGKLAKSGEFKVKEIPGADYNYTPKKQDEDVFTRYIVHYKGNRKDWMKDL